MPKILLAVLVLCVPSLGMAADVLPTAGKAVGLVRDDTPGSWAVVSQDFAAVDVKEIEGDAAKGYLGCFFEGQAGKYLVIKSGGGKLKTFAVTLGGVAPIPVPPGPPTPPEPPKPEPPPNPPLPGPRQVLILHESGTDSPAMSRLLVSMASTKGHDYLKSKGHAYFNFDVDGKGPTGQPDPNVQAWKASLNIPLPALAILDDKGAVLFKVSLADGATADEVISILKAKGG